MRKRSLFERLNPFYRPVVKFKVKRRRTFRKKVIHVADQFRKLAEVEHDFIIDGKPLVTQIILDDPVEEKFVKDFTPKMSGKTAIYIGPSQYESNIAFILRFQGRQKFQGQAKIKINSPRVSHLILTSEDLKQLHTHGLNKNSKLCIVEAIQGIDGSKRGSRKLNKTLGMPWPVHLMQEVIAYSKKMGMKGVLILKPEYNNKLWDWIKDPNTKYGEKKRAAMMRCTIQLQKGLVLHLPMEADTSGWYLIN